MMDSFIGVHGYDAKKTSVLTSVFPCRFFDHVIVLCNGNSNMKEGPFGYFVMRGIIGDRM